MKKLFTLAMVLGLCLATTTGFAADKPKLAFSTGEEFYASCSVEENKLPCLVYLQGLVNGVEATENAYMTKLMTAQQRKDVQAGNAAGKKTISDVEKKYALFCYPEDSTLAKKFDELMAFLKANPDRRKVSTAMSFIVSANTAHKCK